MVQWLRLQLPKQGLAFDPWSGNLIPHAATKSSHAPTLVKDPAWHRKIEDLECCN